MTKILILWSDYSQIVKTCQKYLSRQSIQSSFHFQQVTLPFRNLYHIQEIFDWWSLLSGTFISILLWPILLKLKFHTDFSDAYNALLFLLKWIVCKIFIQIIITKLEWINDFTALIGILPVRNNVSTFTDYTTC